MSFWATNLRGELIGYNVVRSQTRPDLLGHQRGVHNVHGQGPVGSETLKGGIIVEDVVFGDRPDQASELALAGLRMYKIWSV